MSSEKPNPVSEVRQEKETDSDNTKKIKPFMRIIGYGADEY